MDYKIPLFDLNFDKEEENAVIETLRSKWISTGPKVAQLESEFSQLLHCEYSLATANCTVSLHLALIVLGIGKGDEVICPSLTFVATANAIRYVDATPIFCDVSNLSDLTIDPIEIEKSITSKTKAIIVMHFAGFACNMGKIMEIAKRYNLKVIEDACHGPLSEYEGRKLGTIGDVGCFSFFSNKNISTGEGGMLVTNNKELYERSKLLRSHGMTSMSFDRASGHATSYDVVDLGYNYRMDDIRASIAIVQLSKLKSDLSKRAELRKYYESKLSSIEGLIVPFQNHEFFSSNYIFPIILLNSNAEKRDLLRQKLAEVFIQTSVHYPAVHKFSIYKEYSKLLSITEYASDNLVTLPLYSRLTIEQIDYIVKYLKAFI